MQLLDAVRAEDMIELLPTDVEDARATFGADGAALRLAGGHFVERQNAVFECQRKDPAEKGLENEIAIRLGVSSLERAPAGTVEKHAAIIRGLSACGQPGRKIRINNFAGLEPVRGVSVLSGIHQLLHMRGVRKNPGALFNVDPDASFAADGLAVAGLTHLRETLFEQTAIDLQRRNMGQSMPPQCGVGC